MGAQTVSAMKLLKVVLAVLVCIGFVQGKKNEKLKYDKTGMKTCRTEMDDIQPKINKLREDLDLVYKCLNTSGPADPNYFDYCVGPPEEGSSVGQGVLHLAEGGRR